MSAGKIMGKIKEFWFVFSPAAKITVLRKDYTVGR
jgi:hypothetical protein